MLLRFRASNFRSFRAEQELSMIAGAFSDRAETVRNPPGNLWGERVRQDERHSSDPIHERGGQEFSRPMGTG